MPLRMRNLRRARGRETPLPFLEGERIALRPLRPQDARGPYVRWFNDAVVCAENGHHLFPYTAQEAAAYIERSSTSRDELALAIVRRDTGAHIGNIVLKRIDPVARCAELAIVIGDRESWGKGYSKEAARLLLDHGFFALNLSRVACGTYASNAPMRKLAAFLGMREEGRRRRAAFKRNRFVDVIEYGVLREEYVKRFGAPGGRPA